MSLQLRGRRLGGLCQAGAPACSPTHVDVEHGMAQRQMRDLDEAVFLVLSADIKVHVASAPQRVAFAKPRIGHDFAAARPRLLHRAENVRRHAGARNRDQDVARPGMEFELLGKHVLVAEIVAQAGERGRVVEGERPQPAVLGKIDGQVAGDAGAAAVADENDLVAGVVRLVGGLAHPLAARFQRQLLRSQIGHLGGAHGASQRTDPTIQQFPHFCPRLQCYLSRPVMPLIKAAFSIERRWPTISTFNAPTTLPMKPTGFTGAPAATNGAVTARNASPAPTVSTTFLAKAGMVWVMPPASNVTQPCLPWVTMILEQSMWFSASRRAMSPT